MSLESPPPLASVPVAAVLPLMTVCGESFVFIPVPRLPVSYIQLHTTGRVYIVMTARAQG